MSALERLHEAGQSIWLDSISRDLLESGTLARYAAELFVTGLTSNPTLFERAVASTDRYDGVIRSLPPDRSPEDAVFAFSLEDIVAAADCFRPGYDATGGRDGFASLEVSPRLAHDARATIAAAMALHARAARPNVLIKVPGTPAGRTAIEELVAAGIPINVTLLFSESHYRESADAYLRGVERRLAAGHDPNVASVASLFVSRWDAHTASRLPPELANRLGIAVAQRSYCAYREILDSPRWRRLAAAGAQPQRLLWASTGTKDPALPETYYVTALAAEGTVDTMPEKTLLAFAEHGALRDLLGEDPGEADRTLAAIRTAGVDVDALAARLQVEGAESFVASWDALLRRVESKRNSLHAA